MFYRGHVWVVEYRWYTDEVKSTLKRFTTWMPLQGWHRTRKDARTQLKSRRAECSEWWIYRIAKYGAK